MIDILNQPIQNIKGIGPNRSKLIESDLGIKSLGDLLFIFPYRYVDKTLVTLIKDVQNKSHVQVVGTLIDKSKVKGGKTTRLKATIRDSSGLMELVWFKSPQWIEDKLVLGKKFLVYGKATRFKGILSISHPELEDYAESKLQARSYEPVYSATEKVNKLGFNNKKRSKIILETLSKINHDDIKENLPDYLRSKLDLIDRIQALRWIHFPPHAAALAQARKRIKFEEVFYFKIRLLYNKQQRKLKYKGEVFSKVGDYFNNYYAHHIPFELTNAQKRVIKEIRADLGSGSQMNRLLQGDVGSGKTMVALLSMLIALDNGYQSVLVAPTEILAQQHYLTISDALKGSGIRTAFLSGSVKGRTRTDILRFLQEGELNILIGTHAVLEDKVIFDNLGLAIVDEQHRFGVLQRSKLWQKGRTLPPHMLVMTATPIPRTLAMTVYGDLDVSVIDELPPGRKPVKTIHKMEKNRSQVIEFMHKQIQEGHQIYIVYPLIDESEKLDLANLQQGYENLLTYFPPPDYKISVVHGRMKPADKDLEMKRFSEGKTHIMVATTVIEVGVNVPNASVMVIENTERFGLSQLHQLRGRVGRGADQSFCILMSSSQLSVNAKSRIKIMVSTTDGFLIAEEDLKLRGPGDIEGTKQSGVQAFRLFDLIEDENMLDTTHDIATLIISRDPQLDQEPNLIIQHNINRLNRGYKDWGRIG